MARDDEASTKGSKASDPAGKPSANAPKGAPKKRPAKKRKKKGDANGDAKGEASARKKTAPPAGKAERAPGSLASKVWLALLAVGLIELWAFGSRGHIELCVAHAGTHEFALLAEERTDANTRRYPSCEKRTNLGIVSGYDESLEDAAIQACRRATILRPKELTIACVIKDAGWQHQVTTSWCPPWHDHYYKRLFWFAFDP